MNGTDSGGSPAELSRGGQVVQEYQPDSSPNRSADLPAVTVIVPVYNDQRGLERCLKALVQQTYPVDRYDVIVVDNGSSPPIRLPPQLSMSCVVLREMSPGSYAARNRGLLQASGQVLAFTDADCLPSATWIEAGVAALQANTGVGLVAGRVDVCPLDPSAPTVVELYEQLAAFPQARQVRERQFGATANVFTRRGVVDQVGVFCADLKSGGDMEWGQRIARAGYSVKYAPDVVVVHPARRTLTELWRQAVRVAGGRRDIERGVAGDVLKRAARPLQSAFASVAFFLRHPELNGVTQRLAVLFVGVVVRVAYSYERIRLALGGSSRR